MHRRLVIMKRPKLLALFPSYHSREYPHPVGGGEISNRVLLEGLVDSGWEVVVVASNTDVSGIYNGVFVYKSADFKNRVISVLRRQRDLRKLSLDVALKFKPDIIICGPTALAFSGKIAKMCGVRHGLMVRAFENFEALAPVQEKKTPIIRKIAKMLLGNYQANRKPADFYIFNSIYMERRISPVINSPSYVVYPSIDIERRLNKVRSIKNVHMVGLTKDKGFEIFKGLARRFPKLNFYIYGKRSELILDHELPENVTYKGWADVEEVYGGADVFLVPSQWEEPFGRVSVEALAFGCIVLVSDKGGLPETVSFEHDLIVKSDDLGKWYYSLYSIINDLDKYSSCADRAASEIWKYSTSNQIREFERILLGEIS